MRSRYKRAVKRTESHPSHGSFFSRSERDNKRFTVANLGPVHLYCSVYLEKQLRRESPSGPQPWRSAACSMTATYLSLAVRYCTMHVRRG
jgi:hypothetical protein